MGVSCSVCGWAIPTQMFYRILRYVRGDDHVCQYCYWWSWSERPSIERTRILHYDGARRHLKKPSLKLTPGGDVA